MGSRVEDLLSLARMLDEGKVSQQEYELVKAELLAAPADEWLTEPVTPSANEVEAVEEIIEPDTEEPPLDGPAAQLDLAALADLWIGKAKDLPAPIRWGSVTLVALLLGVALFGGDEPPPAQAAAPPEARSPAVEEVGAGSLGIRLGELPDAWNDAGIPPDIREAFALTPEAGPLDTFLHRFDGSALLAGAYDPGDDAVYALMLKVGLGHPAIGDLNSHVCHLIHPFSQACLDAFRDATGVDAIGDLEGVDQEATWQFEGNTWRLSVADDVETLRVIAPGRP
jgi:hypothetical protein